MSGNDDVLAVEDTDMRSPVTKIIKRNSFSPLHKTQQTSYNSVVKIWQTPQNTLVKKARINFVIQCFQD